MRRFRLDLALTPDGWRRDLLLTLADDGRIEALEPGGDPAAPRLAGAAIPGVPNLHSHAFQRAMAGLTETAGPSEDSFWTWREWMYRFLDRLNPDDVEAIAALAYVEMLEGGFTRVGEFHYLHHDPLGRPYVDIAELALRHVAAAEATGIALTLLPVFYAHSQFGGAPPTPGQRRFVTDLDEFARLAETARKAALSLPFGAVGIAPHSLRAVTAEELAALVAAFPEGPAHIHVAEQTREVDDCLAIHGVRPVARLAELVDLGPRWCLIHATHADARERAAIAAAGATVGLCPVTEANLGDGLFGAPDFLAANGRVGVGTDSNVSISAAEELRMLEYAQRLSTRRRNVVAPRGASSGRTLLDRAVAAGAAALDQPGFGLRAGAPADIVILDTGAIAFAGREDDAILDAWIFGAGRSGVKDVLVAGVAVVKDGRHVARDRIEAAARAAFRRIMAA